MSNQQKQKEDLRNLRMHPFVQFTKEDRERADEFLELEKGAGKEEKKEKDKQKDGPATQKKVGKSKKLKTGEKEKAPFICDYCNKEFPFASKLKMHVPVHTGQKDFHCNLCDFSTSRKVSLEEHIRRHLKEKNFNCPEPNCGASFTSSRELRVHESNHNKNNKKISCSRCPFKTNSKYLLTLHVKSIHSESRPFKCPHENCEYSAKLKKTLNQHMKVHSLEKNQICPAPNCGFKTNSSGSLKSHMKTHSNGEKQHKCHFCDFSSHRHGSLVRHIRQHTGETPFSCQLCSYKSKDKSNLKKHMKKHAE